MKIKYTDFGRCLVCLQNPCECKKTKPKPKVIEKGKKKRKLYYDKMAVREENPIYDLRGLMAEAEIYKEVMFMFDGKVWHLKQIKEKS